VLRTRCRAEGKYPEQKLPGVGERRPKPRPSPIIGPNPHAALSYKKNSLPDLRVSDRLSQTRLEPTGLLAPDDTVAPHDSVSGDGAISPHDPVSPDNTLGGHVVVTPDDAVTPDDSVSGDVRIAPDDSV
jgi:hypothetical protein